MLHVIDETYVAHQPFVPPAERGREERRHINFIDRRVISHPRIPLGKPPGILREIIRPVGILKIPQPVGQSKVQQVDDNVAALKNLAFSAEELRKIDGILASKQSAA